MSEESTSGVALGEIVWARLLDKRVIVKEAGSTSEDLFEYTVLEASPSGLRVKFRNAAGRTFWTSHKQYIPVEILS